MKKLLLFFVAMLALIRFDVSAAMFSTSPGILQEDSKDVRIIFDASQSEVAAIQKATALYAHIGVTFESAPAQWTHVIGSWSTNTDNKKFVKNNAGLWELPIGDIRTYFGITDNSEKIAKIAIIARTADGKSQTADHFIDIAEPGFQIRLDHDAPSNVLSQACKITFSLLSTNPCDLSLSVDGTTIASKTNTTSISVSHEFNAVGSFNQVVATARNGATTLNRELTIAYPGQSPLVNYPGGEPRQGAIRNADGTVTFCIAAPEKKSVLLHGSWNDYAPTKKSLMNRHDHKGVSYFWTTTEQPLEDGKYWPYYYSVDGSKSVGDPYAKMILDPWNDKSIPAGCFEDMPAYPHHLFNDKVLAVYRSDMDEYDWDDATLNFDIPNHQNLIIYELLLRDFTGDGSDIDGKRFGTFRSALPKIQYLKNLGINAVELMPVMEFSGNNSWGYNPNFYMAVDKAYGTPSDMRDFVAECHRNGIAVILDIVLNHADGLHPWYQMYDASKSPFFNSKAPHSYNAFNDWNQDYPLVASYWSDVLKFWMEAYKVDGFRFDLVKGLGSNESYGTGGNAATDRYNASRIARMKELHAVIKSVKPDGIHVNELLGTSDEENENGADGQLNWVNINGASATYAKGVGTPDLRGFYASQWGRRVGQTVDYAESHDEKRIARAIVESGHSSVKYSGSTPSEAAIKRLGAVAAQMLLCPGAKMIWQFGELAADDMQGSEMEKLRAIQPKWDYLNDPVRKSLHNLYRTLCHFRLMNNDLFSGDKAECIINGLSSPIAQQRSITLRSDNKEVIAMFNPDVTGSRRTVSVSAAHISSGNSQLIATSWQTEPNVTYSSGQINANLAPGEFCILATNNVAGTDTPEADRLQSKSQATVAVSCGRIIIIGEYDNARVFTTQGQTIRIDEPVAPGIYLVIVDGQSHKVVVR